MTMRYTNLRFIIIIMVWPNLGSRTAKEQHIHDC